MSPTDIIVIAITALIILGVVIYIVKQKKKGRGCIGCPYSKQCGGKCCPSQETSDKK